MKKIFFLLSLLISIPLPSHATDINFSLFNINTPEQNKLLNTYSNAYGLPPLQVAPVMSAPAQEIPTILQIAKNAATLPLVVWGLKNQGKSYMDILNTFLLPPSILFNPSVNYDRYGNDYLQAWKYQQQYGSQWPKTISIADSVIIGLSQLRLFTDYLRVPSARIIQLPTNPLHFTNLVLYPHQNNTYFLPPGQAKKVGLWMPPGQAKKVGLWAPPGQAKKEWKEDHGHGHGFEDHGRGHGKDKWGFSPGGGNGKGHGHGRGHD